jgi:hypothetical protein
VGAPIVPSLPKLLEKEQTSLSCIKNDVRSTTEDTEKFSRKTNRG